MACPKEKSQKRSLEEIKELGSHEDFPLIVFIYPKPCEKSEKKAGCKLAGRKQPQKKSGIGHGVHQPLLGRKLQPETDKRNPLGCPEYTVIFNLQRRKYGKKMHTVS